MEKHGEFSNQEIIFCGICRYFVAYAGANSNRWLWNHIKITRFTIFVRGEKVWFKVFNVCRRKDLPKLNKFKQGGGRVQTCSFYDNAIIECPLLVCKCSYNCMNKIGIQSTANVCVTNTFTLNMRLVSIFFAGKLFACCFSLVVR